MKGFKTGLTGERINLFENNLTNSIKDFNILFKDFPIDLEENNMREDTEIEIGTLVKSNCYEIINLMTNEKFDHYFERRNLDESIIDDFSDDDL